jgi:hypothetical protein
LRMVFAFWNTCSRATFGVQPSYTKRFRRGTQTGRSRRSLSRKRLTPLIRSRIVLGDLICNSPS